MSRAETVRRCLLGLFIVALLPQGSKPAWAQTRKAADAGDAQVETTETRFPLNARRIVFLGDSITYAGHYVARIEAQLRLEGIQPLPEIINLGLPSETCSGLSEPGHPFPRPDVHERLDRALSKLKPDVVVACYGMNDGIYHPLSDERFAAFRGGVDRLIAKVHDSGAGLILMTPPPFDPVPLRDKGKLQPAGKGDYAYFAMYENYDKVLERYAQWILSARDRVEMVIDVHGPLKKFASDRRQLDPGFTLTPDGIHPDETGHRLLAQSVLKAWGVPPATEPNRELLEKVTRRLALIRDAWLVEVGHQRPGMRAGLPLADAVAQSAKLEAEIQKLVDAARHK